MRRRLLLPVLGCCLAISAAAADGIRIGGRVLVPGGTPLPEAEVLLLPLLDPLLEARNAYEGIQAEPVTRALTDDDGRYELQAPHAGLWRVLTAAPGFVPLEARLSPLIEAEELPDAGLVTDVGMTVRVLGAGAAPIAGAQVRLDTDRSRYDFSTSIWKTPVRRGRTDAEGKVRLARGDREGASIAVLADGHPYELRRGLHGTAATVQLASGKSHAIQVVSQQEKRPLSGVLVQIGKLPIPIAVTDDEGRLSLFLGSAEPTPINLLADDGRRLETRLTPKATPDKTAQAVTLPDRLLISGRLIDGDTRRPVGGGIVWDAEEPVDAAVTDAAGGFVLGGPSGRRLQIAAGAPGYLRPRPVEFQLAGDGRPGPTLVLKPAAAIEGKVVDENGNPIAGAQVDIKIKHAPGMMRIEIGGESRPTRALTNSRGDFRLSPIDPGENYTVKVRAAGHAPGETRVSNLEPYRTKTGVEVMLSAGRTLVGTVIDGDGRPVRDVAINVKAAAESGGGGMFRMMQSADAPTFEADSDGDGRFEIGGVPEGTFDLETVRSGYAKRKVAGIEVQPGDEPLDLGAIGLLPGHRFQGIALDRTGQPVEGVEVKVGEAGPEFTLLSPGDSAPEQQPDAVTDPGGWFAVDDLAPGTSYDISLRRRGFIAAKVSGAQVPQLEPEEVLMDPASDIGGVVHDPAGEPVAGAQISMKRTQTMELGGNVMQMMMMEGATTDAEGRFLFEDQEPGTISLSAVASHWQEVKRDGIEIPKGEDVTDIVLPVEPGAIVEGRVLTPDGRPAIGASVKALGESEGMMPGMGGTPTDGNGYYRLEGLAPGESSIEATHEDYPRTVKDLEVDPGINALDLHLEGGHEVTGQVLSVSGEPIGVASVRLVPAGRFWGGPETRTRADGTFNMPGVQDGDYNIRAEAEGYAATDGKQSVKVAAEAVHGVEVRMTSGAAVSGRIGGLAPEKFSEVDVTAQGPSFGGFDGTRVDREGNYRIENLLPGDYTILARVSSTGRQAKGQVAVEEGQTEAVLDLEFGEGIALSGRAVQGDTPLTGAMVRAEGVDIQHSGWNQTDREGRFRIEGLEPGRYKVHLQDWQSGLRYDEEFDVATSREIVLEIPSGSVAGRITDSADRQPLAGVTVTLQREQADASGSRPNHTATTDVDGNFRMGSVADGNWNLTANKQGYAAQSITVGVEFERVAEDVQLKMDPTEGLTLQARHPSGSVPGDIRVAVLDSAGRPLVTGNYATGENGRVRLSSVPPGSWEIIASAAGSAVVNLTANAPGATVPLLLEPACRLSAHVPELTGSDSMATATLVGSDGRPFRTLSWSGNPQSEWRLSGGRIEFASLPPGSWTVKVVAADGRSWEGSSTTAAGTMADVVLE